MDYYDIRRVIETVQQFNEDRYGNITRLINMIKTIYNVPEADLMSNRAETEFWIELPRRENITGFKSRRELEDFVYKEREKVITNPNNRMLVFEPTGPGDRKSTDAIYKLLMQNDIQVLYIWSSRRVSRNVRKRTRAKAPQAKLIVTSERDAKKAWNLMKRNELAQGDVEIQKVKKQDYQNVGLISGYGGR